MTASEQDEASRPLFEGDEAILWTSFRDHGSTVARSKLFSLHAPFARQIAKRHFKRPRAGDIEYPDLCQLAYVGLLEAIDRFNPSHGSPFRGYAARRVTGSILDGLARASEMRQQSSYRNRARYERIRSLAPPEGDLAASAANDALKVFEDLAIGLALGFILEDSGMYQPEEARDLRPGPYDSLAWTQTVNRVRAAIDVLPEREQFVIRAHYLDDMDFTHVAASLGVGKARVSQIHRAAINSLKTQLRPDVDFRIKS